MTRLDAIHHLLDNADPQTAGQKAALLDAVMDVMLASEGAFDMTDTEIETWLNDSLKLVALEK